MTIIKNRNIKYLSLLLSIFTGTSLWGQGLVKNGNFSDELNSWNSKSPYKIDNKIFVSSPASLKLNTENANRERWVKQDVELEPNTMYELSFYVKGEKLLPSANLPANLAKASGAAVSLYQKRKSLSYGIDGLWKYCQGTFDWKFAKFRFNSKYFKAGKVNFRLCIIRSTGTVWFDNIKLAKVGSKDKLSFEFKLFPFNFIEEKTYSICENLPANLILTDKAKGKYKGKQGSMILELPQFITLGGVVPSQASRINEKVALHPQDIKETLIVRNNKKYRRYEVKFDSYFTYLLGKTWYMQNIFLIAQKGTVGKKDYFYWSVKVGNDQQKEQRGKIKVIAPIKYNDKPCNRFKLLIAESSGVLSPIKSISENYINFWRSLVNKPICFRSLNQKIAKGFQDYIMVGGNDLLFPFANSKKVYHEIHSGKLKNKFDMDIDKHGQISNWYKLEDPDKHFEKYLRNAIREWRRKAPEINNVVWDFEPGPNGFNEGGRARFAKIMNLGHIPTVQEIKGKYKQQWFKYMVQLHAEYIAKVVRIFREEYSDVKFWLCSDPMRSGKNRLSQWCAVDVSLSDNVLDGHMHMPYYCGARYFDDIKFNIDTLKKPFFPINDPAERMLSFFRQYTPEKLKQNIIATAALGGVGFGLWPNDALSGDYMTAIANAYHEIAKVEDFYFTGKRVDKEFTFKAKNTLSKEVISKNKRKISINFPDFSLTSRNIAHKKQGKYIFTLFNYDEKNPLILEVSGNALKFLVKIPPDGVTIVSSAKLPAQAPLQKELEAFQKKSKGKDIFRELKSGKSVIDWSANNTGAPILRMKNNVLRAAIDVFGTGEMVSLKNRSESDMLQNGFLGRLVFYDTKQPPCSFIIENMQINNNVPSVIMKTVVPPFEGANPEANPLMDLECSREFALKNNEVEVSLTFKNPTKKAMRFGFRINNLPQPGKRFAKRYLSINIEKNKIDYNSPMNNLFLQGETKIDFMSDTKTKAWNGGMVTATAKESGLSDTITFKPGPKFTGIYSWQGHGMITVELLSPNIILKPGEIRKFNYSIGI